MPILAALEGRSTARPRAELIPDQEPLASLIALTLGSGESDAGEMVNEKRALECPPVAAAVRVMGESVAGLPFHVLQKGQSGAREKLDDHWLLDLFGNAGKPNGWMSPFDFFEFGTRRTALRGACFWFKNTVRGTVREIVPLKLSQVTPKQDENFRVTYEVRKANGTVQTYGPDSIFHLRGPSDDSFLGNDIIKQMRHAIGLALAQDKHASKMFANMARLAGVLEMPGHFENRDRIAEIRTQFERVYGGTDNAFKTAILEEDMKFRSISMNSAESELLGSRSLQRSVLAAIWRIPPHMIGDLSKATFSNIENLARQFVDYALVPWLRRWEQAIQCQFLSAAERADGIYVKLDPRGLLRGNTRERGEFISKMIASRVINPNEARAWEDLPPYEGGDEFGNPNIEPMGAGAEPTEPTNPEEERG